MVCPAHKKAGPAKAEGVAAGAGTTVGVTVAVGLGQGVAGNVGEGNISARAVLEPHALSAIATAKPIKNKLALFCRNISDRFKLNSTVNLLLVCAG